MKTIRFLVVIVAAIALSGCKVEGCTDPEASNYDVDANDNDGSCNYEGDLVFWYNETASAGLINDGSTSLTYYINNQVVGSSASNTFWNSAPNCGQNSSVTATIDLGSSQSVAVSYSVVDQDSFEIWAGDISVDANSCLALELAW